VSDQSAALSFPQELARLLAERGLGQRELERRTGISQAHLSRVLAGKMPASDRLTEPVAKALDLPTDYFIETQLSRIAGELRNDPALRMKVYRMVKRR